jgi:hypothetical protein
MPEYNAPIFVCQRAELNTGDSLADSLFHQVSSSNIAVRVGR